MKTKEPENKEICEKCKYKNECDNKYEDCQFNPENKETEKEERLMDRREEGEREVEEHIKTALNRYILWRMELDGEAHSKEYYMLGFIIGIAIHINEIWEEDKEKPVGEREKYTAKLGEELYIEKCDICKKETFVGRHGNSLICYECFKKGEEELD